MLVLILPAVALGRVDFQSVKQTLTVRVAICQICCLDGDRSGNIVRIENAVTEAKKAYSDIACFPETSLLGWVNPDAHQRASHSWRRFGPSVSTG